MDMHPGIRGFAINILNKKLDSILIMSSNFSNEMLAITRKKILINIDEIARY